MQPMVVTTSLLLLGHLEVRKSFNYVYIQELREQISIPVQLAICNICSHISLQILKLKVSIYNLLLEIFVDIMGDNHYCNSQRYD